MIGEGGVAAETIEIGPENDHAGIGSTTETANARGKERGVEKETVNTVVAVKVVIAIVIARESVTTGITGRKDAREEMR